MKQWGWILGWAVPAQWFVALAEKYLPQWQHTALPANPGAVDEILTQSRFDRVGGYSLGAHLLLAARPNRALFLLAPFLAFPSEAKLGGKISRTQLKFLSRWLQREPSAALVDFYRRADLNDIPAPEFDGETMRDLKWGLEQLERSTADTASPEWKTWCGARDPLLDSASLQTHLPHLRVVAEGTHHPGALLEAVAKDELS